MGIRFTNTLIRRVEPFVPLAEGKVGMYHCGPTVYDHPHIGNFRSFLFADLLRRFFEFRGYEVRQVMNLTDVGHLTQDDIERGEDKMVRAAREAGLSVREVADRYTEEFFRYLDLLNFRRAHHYPRATDHIPEMIEMIRVLLDRKFAYRVGGNVYFDISRFPEYGKLSGNTLRALRIGARLEPNPEKRHPADFALWKQDPRHLMQWDSPWGRGFPGWHIECSAMSMKYLGQTFDIHTGGEDNIFPHHESELAQSEAFTGRPFVRFYLHVRFLLVDGRKMSKSLGNFLTLRDLQEKGVDPMALRYELLRVHYRMPQNFTLDSLEGSKRNVDRLREVRRRLVDLVKADRTGGGRNKDLQKTLQRNLEGFGAALDDDLNIAQALARLFESVNAINKSLASGDMSSADAEIALDHLSRVDSVLGVLERETEVRIDPEVERLVHQREEARKKKDWETADRLRAELRRRGVLLQDTKEGTKIRVL